jgi:hypothetical protein
MTAKTMIAGIKTDAAGIATGRLRIEQLQVIVQILDARKVWDRVDYLIRPIQGTGEQWVCSTRVTQ